MKNIGYSDLYDRVTVDECRELVRSFERGLSKIPADEPDRDEKIRVVQTAHNLFLWIKKGERAEAKAAAIRKWEERDQKREDLLASSDPPKDVSCLRCRERRRCTDKHLDFGEQGDRVIMFFECPNGCLPRRAFYNDGSEYRPKPSICNKCRAPVVEQISREDHRILIISTCEQCKNIDEHEIDLTPKETEEIDEHFVEDRTKYCFDEEGLSTYRDGKFNLERTSKLANKWKEERANPTPEKSLPTLRMLKVIELRELVKNKLESLSFEQVEVSTPTTEQGIQVKISALDGHKKRTDEEAVKVAQDTLESALKETNWRLMKGSLKSTLGALAMELKGYISETDVRKLLEAENPPKVSGKVDGITL